MPEPAGKKGSIDLTRSDQLKQPQIITQQFADLKTKVLVGGMLLSTFCVASLEHDKPTYEVL